MAFGRGSPSLGFAKIVGNASMPPKYRVPRFRPKTQSCWCHRASQNVSELSLIVFVVDAS